MCAFGGKTTVEVCITTRSVLRRETRGWGVAALGVCGGGKGGSLWRTRKQCKWGAHTP